MCDQKDMGDPSATASCHMRDTRARDLSAHLFQLKLSSLIHFTSLYLTAKQVVVLAAHR